MPLVSNLIRQPRVGDTITELETFDNRPLDAEDGDTLVLADTGTVYRFSSVLEDWIRTQFYGPNLSLIGRIRGNVVPSSESPVWTEATIGSGTVTTDGSRVIFDTVASLSDHANAQIDHPANGNPTFLQGYLEYDSVTLDGSFEPIALQIRDGARDTFWAAFRRNGTDEQNFLNIGSSAFAPHTTQIQRADQQVVLREGEHWIEVYIDPNANVVWQSVDHSPFSSIQMRYTNLETTTATNFLVGDGTGAWSGNMYVRNLTVGQF